MPTRALFYQKPMCLTRVPSYRNAGQICIRREDQIQDYIVHFDNLMEAKTVTFSSNKTRESVI